MVSQPLGYHPFVAEGSHLESDGQWTHDKASAVKFEEARRQPTLYAAMALEGSRRMATPSTGYASPPPPAGRGGGAAGAISDHLRPPPALA